MIYLEQRHEDWSGELSITIRYKPNEKGLAEDIVRSLELAYAQTLKRREY